MRRIATEEGFTVPELVEATGRYLATADDEPGQAAMRASGWNPRASDPHWRRRLADLGDLRIADMDTAGIDVAILIVGSPGVQIFDPAEGTELASLINDRAATAARALPGRLVPLATLAPQDPDAAAAELERAVTTLGMPGAAINSHTKGAYLDEPRFRPILEAAVALDVPIYIHPREPSPQMVAPFLGPSMSAGALWGFAAEAGLHGVRLIMEGVFDLFPTLRIVLGHAGEGIPLFMDRLDLRYREESVPSRVKLKRRPSDYVKENFVVTSSGVNWPPAIAFCQQVMGTDKVLFAADYPFEDATEAVTKAEATPMPDEARAQFFHRNAERVFAL